MTPIVTWSTRAVPRAQRLDYFAHALSSAIVPMRVERTQRGALTSHMSMLDIEGIAILEQRGSQHRSVRGRAEIERSGAHTFHLIVNRRTHWHIEHLGRTRVGPGQAFIVDSRAPNVIEMPSDYDVIHVMLPDAWLRRWVHDPAPLVGRALGGSQGIEQALAAFSACLSPSAMQSTPLSATQMLDHLGAMLALSSREAGLPVRRGAPLDSMRRRIVACMANRCGEPSLTAHDVACVLGIDDNELHRVLASSGETFAGVLLAHRTEAARRMLASRAFQFLTLEEIAQRAGFADASQSALRHLR
ncbi:AraC-type DNA-binding protein [Cupriavidus sp. YR651]|uniref:AraC-like ligand-binding domain-containing protein n=1 Tax=Cupriavidus sp. YR651 TaxID=1855315 RepID=UPI00088CCD0B|nr:helix-turn-helix transcriptional regulator [Cupriavidus sp. YR651]SDD73613.1 AraC-type DNA-binding protein [Cupriavidus sp. YR651]